MDSVTQALLGGAVGLAVAGRHHPRRAWLYGALAGTLPDLDVVVDYASAIDDFTRHRGFSHSWLVHTVVAPLLAPVMSRLDKNFLTRTWMLLLWLVFVTHSALDALTVYGTQVFWPLPVQPVMGGSVFIIDPLYSLPLLILAIVVLASRQLQPLRASALALTLSTGYLAWGLAAQQLMEHRVAAEIERQGIDAERVAVTAAPFTTLLWRIVVMTPDRYLQGYASVLDETPLIRFAAFPRGSELTGTLADDSAYRRFNWFNHGFGAVDRLGDKLVVKDLRMGSEPVYVFRFVVKELSDGEWRSVTPYRIDSGGAPDGFFASAWRRIWDESGDDRMLALAARPAKASENDHAPDECGKRQADEDRC